MGLPRTSGASASDRIKEIKILLLEGKTEKEIADELGYSSQNCVNNAMKSAGLKSPRRKRILKKVKAPLSRDEVIRKLLKARKI